MDEVLNPIIKKYLGSVIRAALMMAVPYLVSQGIWTIDEATATMTSVAVMLSTLSWSLYEKYRSQKRLVTALASPEGTTQKQVEQIIATEVTPPVTVKKTIAPYMAPTK